MKHRDWVKRTVKTVYGERYTIYVERVIFDDNTIHRVLPEFLLPFKHYERAIVEMGACGLISDDILEFEDCPCKVTIARWMHELQPL